MTESFKWVAPALVIPPASEEAKNAPPGRQNFGSTGSGHGSPVFSAWLSPFVIAEGAAAATVVGALVVTPAGAVVTLTNDAGGLFALSGSNIVATSTATNYVTAPFSIITVRLDWGGKFKHINLEIDVTAAAVTNITLSAATLAHGVAQGTAIGTLASVPTGAVLTLTVDVGGKYQIVGNALQAGATPSTAGTDVITVRAARGPQTFSKTFNITVT